MEKYYSLSDFKQLRKIDIHCHLNTIRTEFPELALRNGFQIVTINTDVDYFEFSIAEQEENAHKQMKHYPDKIGYFSTFPMAGFENHDWSSKCIDLIKNSISKGALGVKVWKNIGMEIKKPDGSFLMIDDDLFDEIFEFLTSQKIPLLMHIGEPKSCWLPLEKILINYDREYFETYPQYHMFLHPEYPAYEELIASRDRFLDKFPELTVIGAHLGSMEWSIELMSSHLDQYPNLYYDLAARMSYFQLFSLNNRVIIRDFCIKYQNRLLYGTDSGDYNINDEDLQDLMKSTEDDWKSDWEFLVSDRIMATPKLDGSFQGLKLPKNVVDKIYYKNALKLFPQLGN